MNFSLEPSDILKQQRESGPKIKLISSRTLLKRSKSTTNNSGKYTLKLALSHRTKKPICTNLWTSSRTSLKFTKRSTTASKCHYNGSCIHKWWRSPRLYTKTSSCLPAFLTFLNTWWNFIAKSMRITFTSSRYVWFSIFCCLCMREKGHLRTWRISARRIWKNLLWWWQINKSKSTKVLMELMLKIKNKHRQSQRNKRMPRSN